MYFTYWQTLSKNEWRWRLVAKNNKIIAHGEGYKNQKDCLQTITLIQSSSLAPVKRKKFKI